MLASYDALVVVNKVFNKVTIICIALSTVRKRAKNGAMPPPEEMQVTEKAISSTKTLFTAHLKP